MREVAANAGMNPSTGEWLGSRKSSTASWGGGSSSRLVWPGGGLKAGCGAANCTRSTTAYMPLATDSLHREAGGWLPFWLVATGRC